MTDELKQNRQNLTQTYLTRQRELIKQQRKYKKIITTKYISRKDSIGQASYLKNIEHLKAEKADIRAQLWVANGPTHLRQNKNRLKNIKCHVSCQEKLNSDNNKLKSQIQVLEMQLKQVNKSIYDLNRKTIPDNQHQAYVQKVRRTKDILENQLEVNVKRECNFTASNQLLREDVVRMINFRAFFNSLYTKMIQQLRNDNKYLTDLIEHAQLTFENGTIVYEKIIAINKKEMHDREIRKVEMQSVTRKTAQDNENFDFFAKKDKKRELCDLEPREYKRRNIFKKAHGKKIRLYKNVLNKILQHSNTQAIEKVIENFQEQESLYYSYFNFANEKNYHITRLDTSLNDLYQHIENLRTRNKNTLDNQLETIIDLENKLKNQLKTNNDLEEKRKICDKTLSGFFKEILGVIMLCRADVTPLQNLLGDHSKISAINVKEFLQILEKRLNQIVARVFILQRRDPKIKPGHYIVRNLQKMLEQPTDPNHIVLTQQCPECAEGEAVNTDGKDCVIETTKEIQKKLHEKVVQPEMQYRLHSLSECRLQRSRMLASSKLN
ncbi:uncharacterized protein LOC129953653 [Eupeodes corollae]|uniref:uncharacterized protein LOC129953653 n=1 Tax=Eupeodes corollae TaxID=290404 RepID=UPI0024916A6E|nr:uncharacterized protein LOC129953653 [Eupeodes corollae]